MNNITNFCILAHIDHGKSTLADRFLELTGTVPKNKMREQYLDQMELERERGITIKMQPVRMVYRPNRTINNLQATIDVESQKSNAKSQMSSNPEYILNLIDTPGHVDFSYEVSRALAAVEGAILLVDATKGIQAQTLANFELAKKQGLIIIPVINKIDLPNTRVREAILELAQLTRVDTDEVIPISAKNGTNVEKLLEQVLRKIPPPQTDREKPLRALVFDSTYDLYKGVIAFVRVMEGSIKIGDKIYFIATKTDGVVKELGYFAPGFSPQAEISAGEIGYIATGIKKPDRVRTGDTITKLSIINDQLSLEPLPGYQEPKPVVFASFYPEESDKYDQLKFALSQLKLQDPAFNFESEYREALGRGFRCGFLGTLHLEIVSERVQREFKIQLVISSPSVMYKVVDKYGREYQISSASDWPEPNLIAETQEPWVRLEILTPADLMGRITELLAESSGNFRETKHIGNKAILIYEMPLREMIRDFYGRLKSATQGYASMGYEILGWRKADLVKLEILIANRKEEALSQIVAKDEVFYIGKEQVKRLKELLPQQQFAVALQAQVGGRIIARETLRATRKDVTQPLYGGDFTRKRKLLEKQKKGKKELKQKGMVRIPQKVFLELTKSR